MGKVKLDTLKDVINATFEQKKLFFNKCTAILNVNAAEFRNFSAALMQEWQKYLIVVVKQN